MHFITRIPASTMTQTTEAGPGLAPAGGSPTRVNCPVLLKFHSASCLNRNCGRRKPAARSRQPKTRGGAAQWRGLPIGAAIGLQSTHRPPGKQGFDSGKQQQKDPGTGRQSDRGNQQDDQSQGQAHPDIGRAAAEPGTGALDDTAAQQPSRIRPPAMRNKGMASAIKAPISKAVVKIANSQFGFFSSLIRPDSTESRGRKNAAAARLAKACSPQTWRELARTKSLPWPVFAARRPNAVDLHWEVPYYLPPLEMLRSERRLGGITGHATTFLDREMSSRRQMSCLAGEWAGDNQPDSQQ